MYNLNHDEIKNIVPLFNGWEETLIYSVLESCMGKAYTKNRTDFSSALLIIADFAFVAGAPCPELLLAFESIHDKSFIILTPQNNFWQVQIEAVYQGIKPHSRYAIKKEGDIFNRVLLKQYSITIPVGYSIKQIDEELYHTVLANNELCDCCSQFKSFEEYQKNGIGFVALFEDKPISGASSYTFYKSGIEIELDTCQLHRRKGLGRAVAAALILACLKKGLYPSWDAANLESVHIAAQLGYNFHKDYPVYFIKLRD